jgi:hypothetical protein
VYLLVWLGWALTRRATPSLESDQGIV